MAVTILTCPTVEDRTAMLNLWVEVAIESKTAYGNMYGFAGIMFGLCMPQVCMAIFYGYSISQFIGNSL